MRGSLRTMAKDDQQESYEKILSAHHGRMIDLVKFAETKNAALLTFCSVWIGAIIGLLRAPTALPMGYDRVFLYILPLLAVAALLSLKSFLPRFLHHHHKPESDARNLLYFGDIARMKPEQYGQRVRERYYPPENTSYTERYFDDLTIQISVQSQIADRKFKAFTRAAWFVLVAFALQSLPILYALASLGARYGVAKGWL